MAKPLLPLNLSLMSPTKDSLSYIREITDTAYFDNNGNYSENGLFSIGIFGRSYSPERDSTFGFINLVLPIIHPLVYRLIGQMKALYTDIMNGKEYAVFQNGEFIKAKGTEGETGYSFFVKHWKDLQFESTASSRRTINIELINRYRSKALMDKLIVLPAGLRDVEIEEDGRQSVSEINEHYRSILSHARNLPTGMVNVDLAIYDKVRIAIQLKVNAVYDYLETMLSGKKGLIQSKWASRRIFNGTRNVISSLDTSVKDMDAINRPGFNDTVIGLYQAVFANLPVAIQRVKINLIEPIFEGSTGTVNLINPKDLKLTRVKLDSYTLDQWNSIEGLKKIAKELSIVDMRQKPVMIEGYFLAMVYMPDAYSFQIVRDTQGLDKDKLRPLTYLDLFYFPALDLWEDSYGYITRYPAENFNSSTPVKYYIKTTLNSEVREMHNEHGEVLGIAREFPVYQGAHTQYHDSTSIPPSRLAPLGADFDGDTVSVGAVYSNEAKAEIKQYFKTKRAYIQAGGGLAFGVGIHTLNLTLAYLTGDPV